MAKYGLVGKNIGHTFSKTFFTIKFEKENRKDTYHNFDVKAIEELPALIRENPSLKGLNVTTPYKESVMPLLDRIDKEALKIGAVNTIKIQSDGTLIGYNTDHYGFAKALADFFPIENRKAIILGTGGASKAIAYVLHAMSFEFLKVSRHKGVGTLTYEQLTREIMATHSLIINCTPLGTFPNIQDYPHIPYQYIGKQHNLFDLIYNPRETEFLKRGFAKGARVSNGLKMLEYQAKKSWNIWKT